MNRSILTALLLAASLLVACDEPKSAQPTKPGAAKSLGAKAAADKKPDSKDTPGAAKKTPPSNLRMDPVPDAPTAQRDQILFELQDYKDGDRFAIKSTETSEMTVKATAGERVEEGTTESEGFSTIFVTTWPGDPKGARVRLAYDDVRLKQIDKGKKDRFEMITSNKTYFITLLSDGPKITYKSGGDPSKAEIEAVTRDLELLSIGKRFFAMVPKRPLKPGESIEVDKEALRALLFDKGTIVLSVQKPSLIFKELRKVDGLEAGIFEVSLSAVIQDGPITLNAVLSGELAVEVARGRVLRTSWGGPVMMTGNTKEGDQQIKLAGSGQTRQTLIFLDQSR